MVALAPLAFAAGVALLLEWLSQEQKPRKAAKTCMIECTAAWAHLDGIVRIYVETTSAENPCITVECSSIPTMILPGEVDGFPVKIRMDPSISERRRTTQEAAALRLMKALVENGIGIVPFTDSEGQTTATTSDAENRTATIRTSGPEITEETKRLASAIADREGTSVKFEHDAGWPSMGTEPSWFLTFYPGGATETNS